MKRVLEYLEQSKNWLSKITKRKIFILSFGLMFSIMIPPLMTVVSCSESAATQTYRRFSVAKDAVIFDISKLDPSGLISGILGTIGTQMKVPAYDMAPGNPTKYEMVKEYLHQANFTKDTIVLVNGEESWPLDFKDVHANVDKLKEIVDNFTFDQLDPKVGGPAGANAKDIPAVDYTKVILKESDVLQLVSFMNMYNPSTIPKKPLTATDTDVIFGIKKVGDLVTDENEILKTHPYLNLLRSYHKIFYDFVHSPFYEHWIVGKTFVVAVNDSKINDSQGTRARESVQTIVNPGELYDKENTLSLGVKLISSGPPNYNMTKQNIFSKETSNLEFQFFYNLLDLA